MDAQVEKRSEKLGRDALYKKTTKISKLPYYLTVQFVRFEFVQHSQQNTKILRTCNFDMSLDVMDLCNDELKEQLKTVRKKLKDTEDKRLKLGKWAFQVTVCCCALRRRRRRLCQRSAAAQQRRAGAGECWSATAPRSLILLAVPVLSAVPTSQDKKQETAAEKTAKEQAARKALEGGDMLSPGGTRTMEVDGVSAAAAAAAAAVCL